MIVYYSVERWALFMRPYRRRRRRRRQPPPADDGSRGDPSWLTITEGGLGHWLFNTIQKINCVGNQDSRCARTAFDRHMYVCDATTTHSVQRSDCWPTDKTDTTVSQWAFPGTIEALKPVMDAWRNCYRHLNESIRTVHYFASIYHNLNLNFINRIFIVRI